MLHYVLWGEINSISKTKKKQLRHVQWNQGVCRYHSLARHGVSKARVLISIHVSHLTCFISRDPWTPAVTPAVSQPPLGFRDSQKQIQWRDLGFLSESCTVLNMCYWYCVGLFFFPRKVWKKHKTLLYHLLLILFPRLSNKTLQDNPSRRRSVVHLMILPAPRERLCLQGVTGIRSCSGCMVCIGTAFHLQVNNSSEEKSCVLQAPLQFVAECRGARGGRRNRFKIAWGSITLAKKMEMFDQVDSGSHRLSGLRWKGGRGCGEIGFSLIYTCSISPRQRVVSRATCCMTMMLLKFNKAWRCFIRRLPEFYSCQVHGRSVCYKHLIFVIMRGETSDLISIKKISSAVWSLNFSLEQRNICILTDVSHYALRHGWDWSADCWCVLNVTVWWREMASLWCEVSGIPLAGVSGDGCAVARVLPSRSFPFESYHLQSADTRDSQLCTG